MGALYRHDCFKDKAEAGSVTVCRLSSYLDSAGLSVMYKSFVCSCLEYDHLLYFSAARGYLKRLDALQCRAVSVCHSTFPSLEFHWHAAAIGFLC